MSEVKFHTRNITRYFRSLDPAVIAEGREWYPKAYELAVELAIQANGGYYFEADDVERNQAEIAKAAAVIAVLSPRLNWERNKELARHAYSLANGEWIGLTVEQARASWVFGLTDGAGKAFRILVLNEDPNEVVKGPKVRQFWHTIVDPTDPRAVVVDRHAWAVAAGRVLTDEELGKYSGRLGAYDAVSEMYRRAAKILSAEIAQAGLLRHADNDAMGITPAEVQAITWTAWRREHSAKAASNRRNETTQEV